MVKGKQLVIWILCGLMVLESAVFISARPSGTQGEGLNIGIIGGADGPTHIYINGHSAGWPWADKDPPGGKADNGPDGKSGNQADQEARQQAMKEAEEKGLLILVNKNRSIDQAYKPGDLTAIRYFSPDRSKEGRYLRKEAAEQFHKLVEAASEEGYTLAMTTAYRSYGFQQILWDNYVAKEGEEAAAKYSAKPGQSEHQTGLAVDVSSPSVDYQLIEEFGKSKEGIWLSGNAHRFGFILRYPKGKEEVTGYQYEPWHFRYVGNAVAKEIYENDLTLEEYLEQR